MHSSSLLTISQHALLGRVPAQGRGVPFWGGCTWPRGCTCQRGVYLLGGVPVQGVYLSRGGEHAQRVYLPRGVYLSMGCTCPGDVPARGVNKPRGVPAQGVYLPGGVPAWGCTCPGGCTCQGGVPTQGGVPVQGVSAQVLPSVNRMTDRCKNITLPQTLFAGSNKHTIWLVAKLSDVVNAINNAIIYHPQMNFAKVMFLQVSVCPQGSMHGRGACMAGGGGCAWWGHVWWGRHAWQGAVCGRGACMAGEHVWQGACMAGVCAWKGGHVWQGACMAGGHAWQEGAWHAWPPADTMRYVQLAGGTHPTGMHSCIVNVIWVMQKVSRILVRSRC